MIKNKKILVTGCFGFVAQHLIIQLLKENNKVLGVYNKKAATSQRPTPMEGIREVTKHNNLMQATQRE